MTEEDRIIKINEIIWHWLPVRWTDGVHWWEVKDIEIIGTIEDGGVNLSIQKNTEDPILITFTNEELYGVGVLSSYTAKSRVMGI